MYHHVANDAAWLETVPRTIPKLADLSFSGCLSFIHTKVGCSGSQRIGPEPASNSSARGSRGGQSSRVKSNSSAKLDQRNGHRPFVLHCPVRKTPSYRGSRMVRRDRAHPRHRSAASGRAVPMRGSRLAQRNANQRSCDLRLDRPLFSALAAWRVLLPVAGVLPLRRADGPQAVTASKKFHQ